MKRSFILFLPAISLLACLGCVPKRAVAPGSNAVPAASGAAVATAGVRGTCFFVWAEGASTYVCACNGRVRTIDSKGSNEKED